MSTLYHLIYTSKATEQFKTKELDSLMKQARFNNFIYQVTGLLLYGEAQFIQVLEGEKNNIDVIMDKITQDKRHTQIDIITYQPIHERAFDSWNMGLALLSQQNALQKKLIQQCSVELNFEALSNYEANLIIKAFALKKFQQFIQ